MGESAKMTAADQALRLGEAWDRTPRDASLATSLSVYTADGQVMRFSLGAHAPDLSSEDVARIHQLWVEAVSIVGPAVHHRDIVSAALDSLSDELASGTRETALARLRGRQEKASMRRDVARAVGGLARRRRGRRWRTCVGWTSPTPRPLR